MRAFGVYEHSAHCHIVTAWVVRRRPCNVLRRELYTQTTRLFLLLCEVRIVVSMTDFFCSSTRNHCSTQYGIFHRIYVLLCRPEFPSWVRLFVSSVCMRHSDVNFKVCYCTDRVFQHEWITLRCTKRSNIPACEVNNFD